MTAAAVTFESPFDIGDQVHVDGCGQMRMTVTAVLFRDRNTLCEISWFSGSARTDWVEEWRLAMVDPDD